MCLPNQRQNITPVRLFCVTCYKMLRMLILNVSAVQGRSTVSVGISKDEFNILTDSLSDNMFFCGICWPKATITLKFACA